MAGHGRAGEGRRGSATCALCPTSPPSVICVAPGVPSVLCCPPHPPSTADLQILKTIRRALGDKGAGGPPRLLLAEGVIEEAQPVNVGKARMDLQVHVCAEKWGGGANNGASLLSQMQSASPVQRSTQLLLNNRRRCWRGSQVPGAHPRLLCRCPTLADDGDCGGQGKSRAVYSFMYCTDDAAPVGLSGRGPWMHGAALLHGLEQRTGKVNQLQRMLCALPPQERTEREWRELLEAGGFALTAAAELPQTFYSIISAQPL